MKRFAWLVLICAFFFLGDRLTERLRQDDGTLTIATVADEPDTVYLKWRGPVAHPMASDIAEAYRKWKWKAKRFVLELDSPGGLIGHGTTVISVLQSIRDTHHLDTAVVGRHQCASMCVPVYLQGEKRFASPRSRWLFHEVSVRDAVSDEKRELSLDQRRAMTDDFFERFFKPAGVRQDWIASIRPEVEKGDVWRSARQLVDSRANIVTALK